MSGREVAFEVESEDVSQDVFGRLLSQFHGQKRAPRAEKFRYLDTFDWRVHRAGGWLRVAPNGSSLSLSWAPHPQKAVLSVSVESAPEFGADVPAGPVLNRLKHLVDPRRLVPVAEVERWSQSVDLWDEEEKTVCRVVAVRNRIRDSHDSPWTTTPTTVRVEGVRGYDDERQAVERFLGFQLGLKRHRSAEIADILSALGSEAGRDPSKLNVKLSPKATAADATREVHSALLGILKANRQGVIDRVDSEFLHDFRVAVRRTRSVLGQIKGVFPKPAVKHYQDELRWLGGLTGHARDLDVLLLKLPDYVHELEDFDPTALEPLRTALEKGRAKEQARLVTALEGKRFEKFLRNWSEFLSNPKPPQTYLPKAERPILEIASRRIWRRHRTVIDIGKQIDSESPVQLLHDLRIECKKLRYLLEVFRSLYDADAIGRFVKSLKRLQDHLGDFNDAQIHMDLLRESAAGLEGSKTLGAGTGIAIGQLVAHLAHRRELERERFMNEFAHFATKELRGLARKLFSKKAAQ